MMRRNLTLAVALTLIGAGFVMGPAIPAAAESGAPPGTVLLPQSVDFTQQEIDDNWGQDRQLPSGGLGSVSFDGRDDVFHYAIDDDQTDDNQFRRTEGMRNIRDLGTSVEIDLYLDPSWADIPVRAGVWVVGENEDGGRSNAFGIIEFSTARSASDPIEKNEGWRVWVSGVGDWTDLPTAFTYGEWATLGIDLDVDQQAYTFTIDGEHVSTIDIDTDHSSIDESLHLSEIFLNSYNYGLEDIAAGFESADYDVHWQGLDYVLEFNSIRAATAAASDGDTVLVGPGNYDEGSGSWRINKMITVQGAGSDQVTIDRSQAGTYGLLLDGHGVTLKGFTFLGPQTGSVQFGLKIEHASDLLLEDVVVRDSGRTGIDLNTVTQTNLVDVAAIDNNGAGIALRNSAGIQVQGALASGNAWGGLALWAVAGETLTDVQVTDSTFTGQVAGVFAQHPGNYHNIVIGGNTFADNQVQVTDQTGVGAIDLEAALADNHFDRAVVVRENPIVVPAIFSNIQDAVDAADAGDTVEVHPGTYPESVRIETPDLTLRSTDGAQATTLDPQGATFAIAAPDNMGTVTVQGFTISENWVAAGIVSGWEGTSMQVLDNVVMAPATTTQHGNAIQVSGPNPQVIGNEVRIPHQVSPEWSGSGILLWAAQDGLVAGNKVTSSEDDYCIVVAGGMFEAADGEDNEVAGNEAYGCYAGVTVQGGAHRTLVQNNTVYDNENGILNMDVPAYDGFVTDTRAHFNQIENNTLGARDISGDGLDARYNWWGHITGPYGFGDPVSPTPGVKATPWCIDEACTLFEDLQPVLDPLTEPLPLSGPGGVGAGQVQMALKVVSPVGME